MISITDKEILQLLYHRDEQALKETVKQYGALCLSVARNILGSQEDAEECLNDALLAVWNAIPPEQPAHYAAFLLKIVRNNALDRYKNGKRQKRSSGQSDAILDELADLFAAPDSVEQEFDRRELLQAIARFLNRQPKKQRTMFVQRYWHFASYKELSESFGMSENSIQVSISRLRAKLQIYLKKEGLL